jgi:hypothetical protein
LGGEHVESALEAGARGLHVKFFGGAVESGEDEHRAPLWRARGRRHEVARQGFAFERDLDRLDALGHVRCRLDERLA